jgi:hypothetical protein
MRAGIGCEGTPDMRSGGDRRGCRILVMRCSHYAAQTVNAIPLDLDHNPQRR